MSQLANPGPVDGTLKSTLASDRLPLRVGVGMFCATLGLFTALMAPAIIGLAVRVAEIAPDSRDATLSGILAVGALVGMTASPLFGALGDLHRRRGGRRATWIIAGVVVGSLGLITLASANSPIALMAGWIVTQGGYNIGYANIAALLSDVVPQAQRGKFSAAMGIGQYMSLVVASGLVSLVSGHTALIFLLPGTVAVVGVVILMSTVRETLLVRDTEATFEWKPFLANFVINPIKHPDFSWAWLSRFFTTAATFTLASYQAYFLIDRYGYTTTSVAGVVALSTFVSTVMLVLSAAASGYLSDRFGRRRVFVWMSALVLAAGLGMLALPVPFAGFLLIVGVIGIAQGIYAAVDMALIVEVLPDKDNAAKDLGIANVAATLPQSILPAVAPVFLAIGAGGNYAAFFIFGAVCAALGSLFIAFIRSVR